MPEKPINHGWDHRAGGTDPIPGIGGIALAAAYCWGVQGGSFTVPNNSTGNKIPFAHFQTTDTSIFGTSNIANPASLPGHNTVGDSYIFAFNTGLYIAAGMAVWPSGTYAHSTVVDNIGNQYSLNAIAPGNMADELLATTAVTGTTVLLQPGSYRLFYVDSIDGPMVTSLTCDNYDASGHAITSATLGVFWLGTGPDLSQIY